MNFNYICESPVLGQISRMGLVKSLVEGRWARLGNSDLPQVFHTKSACVYFANKQNKSLRVQKPQFESQLRFWLPV